MQPTKDKTVNRGSTMPEQWVITMRQGVTKRYLCYMVRDGKIQNSYCWNADPTHARKYSSGKNARNALTKLRLVRNIPDDLHIRIVKLEQG